MNTQALIVKALLDSDAAAFMKSFGLERPARYEFTRAYGTNAFGVTRWDWEGAQVHIGTIKFLLNLESWWVIWVAPRIFHTLKTTAGSHLMPRRESYGTNVGPFPTKEAASDKLWELYEQS